MRPKAVYPVSISSNCLTTASKQNSRQPLDTLSASLLDEMRHRGVEPDVITYSAAILACEKGEQWERALSLLDEMQHGGIEPNEFSFDAAISACERSGQYDRADSLLREMKQRALEPAVISAVETRLRVAQSNEAAARGKGSRGRGRDRGRSQLVQVAPAVDQEPGEAPDPAPDAAPPPP